MMIKIYITCQPTNNLGLFFNKSPSLLNNGNFCTTLFEEIVYLCSFLTKTSSDKCY